MDKAVNVVLAVIELYRETGLVGAIVLTGIVIGGPLLKWAFADKRADRAYQKALDAAEDQIQRLADDNRMWRELFLKKLGLPESEIKALMEGVSGQVKAIKTEEVKKNKVRAKKGRG